MSYYTYKSLRKGTRIYVDIFQKGFGLRALEDLQWALRDRIIAPVVKELLEKGVPKSEIKYYMSGENVLPTCEYIRL